MNNAFETAYRRDQDPSATLSKRQATINAWFVCCARTLLARGEEVCEQWREIADRSHTVQLANFDKFETRHLREFCAKTVNHAKHH